MYVNCRVRPCKNIARIPYKQSTHRIIPFDIFGSVCLVLVWAIQVKYIFSIVVSCFSLIYGFRESSVYAQSPVYDKVGLLTSGVTKSLFWRGPKGGQTFVWRGGGGGGLVGHRNFKKSHYHISKVKWGGGGLVGAHGENGAGRCPTALPPHSYATAFDSAGQLRLRSVVTLTAPTSHGLSVLTAPP